MMQITLTNGNATNTDTIRIHRSPLLIKFFALVNGEWVQIYKNQNPDLPTWKEVEWANNHPYGWSQPYSV